ncbi:hypothetical protein D5086_008226 [Populus alba]|uniref:Uncharacterized protein n=1 Tax=Populus alba TaxID=43335 RepID=A0ACC4CG94_POPAL
MLKAEAELKRQRFKEDCPMTRVPKQDSRPISMRKTSAGTPTSRRLNYPGKNVVEYECHLQSCIGSHAAGLYTLAMQYLFLLIPYKIQALGHFSTAINQEAINVSSNKPFPKMSRK